VALGGKALSIYLVTGPPGTGKSWFSIRTAFDALDRRKFVATNIELRNGWEQVLARANWIRRVIPGRVARAEARYSSHMFVSGDLEELFRLRLPACRTCNGCKDGLICRREERGYMILDEAHLWLNARTWDQDESGQELSKAQAVEKRLTIVRFFAEHRKLGWRVYLVTQDAGRLDNQVRGNFEYHTHLKNLRKWKAFGFIPVFWFNCFVAVTTWHATKGERLGVQVYLLSKLANLYDTMATSKVKAGDARAQIRLPLTAAQRAARREERTDWLEAA
jgi:hypothetical protein